MGNLATDDDKHGVPEIRDSRLRAGEEVEVHIESRL
jgi:hypothetical protein